MHALGEGIAQLLADVLAWLAYHTARIVLGVVSFGLIRVQGPPGSPYSNEPEFGWLNVIWKWDGKHLWFASHIAYFLGLFVWAAALTAFVYFWRSLG